MRGPRRTATDYRLPRSSRVTRGGRPRTSQSPHRIEAQLYRTRTAGRAECRIGGMPVLGELPVLSGQWSRWPARRASEDAPRGKGQSSLRISALFASYSCSCVLTRPAWASASSLLRRSASRSTAEPAFCTAGGHSVAGGADCAERISLAFISLTRASTSPPWQLTPRPSSKRRVPAGCTDRHAAVPRNGESSRRSRGLLP